MERIATKIPDVILIKPTVREDARGFFFESYHQKKFAELGVKETFVQDNHSKSRRGTLRGLHYQLNHAQAKLCRVVNGEVLDVAVDIRLGSPTFGRWISAPLSAENKVQIFIPRGFAHGFVTLSDSAEFLYKCSDFYYPDDERGILWSDPQLAIDWGIPNPLLSDKDQTYPTLAQAPREHLPRYEAR
jgi:dTDP-4-dehydrorhamnose 3,5-epimerase